MRKKKKNPIQHYKLYVTPQLTGKISVSSEMSDVPLQLRQVKAELKEVQQHQQREHTETKWQTARAG